MNAFQQGLKYLFLLFLLFSNSLFGIAHAQRGIGSMNFEQSCLTDINNPSSQTLSIDERDQIHISRINPETRQLIYTHINADNIPVHEIVANPIDLELSPVTDSAILARHDQVYICSYRSTAMSRELVLFVKNQEGVWWEERIETDGTGGQKCEMLWLNDTLNVATQINGVVYWYSRGQQSWSRQALTEANSSQGFDLKLHQNTNGTVMLTHRSSDYMHLYLTSLTNGQWQSYDVGYSDPYIYPEGAGVRPQAVRWSDGTIWIFHGSRNGTAMLDWDEDGYSLITEDPMSEFSYTFRYFTNDSRSGGINAAKMMIGPDGREECYYLTRELNRSALANDAFGLVLNRFTYDWSLEEFYPLQQSIPGVPNIHLEPEIHSDSAGLPIVSHIDRGVNETKSCYWRLADSDGDGLADEGETRLGTNPMLADTDADGRSDGLEVQQGTNPLVSDMAQPLSWPPEILPFMEEMTGGTEMQAGEMAGMEPQAGEMAGTEMTGGTEMQAGETAGMEPQAGEMAGMEAQAGETAGTEMAGTEPQAGEMAGTETAGMETQAGEMAGTEMAGMEPQAGETAGTEMAGIESQAGETAGTEMAGMESQAGEVPAGMFAGQEIEAGESGSNESKPSSSGGCEQQQAHGTFWAMFFMLTALLRARFRSVHS